MSNLEDAKAKSRIAYEKARREREIAGAEMTEKILKRIEAVTAQDVKYNKTSASFKNRREKSLDNSWGWSFMEYDTRSIHLDFKISNTGNRDTIQLVKMLNRVLRPLKFKVRELRVFVPERGQNYLSFGAYLSYT